MANTKLLDTEKKTLLDLTTSNIQKSGGDRAAGIKLTQEQLKNTTTASGTNAFDIAQAKYKNEQLGKVGLQPKIVTGTGTDTGTSNNIGSGPIAPAIQTTAPAIETTATDFNKGVTEGKYTQNSNGEYLDSQTGKVVGKIGVGDTPGVSTITGGQTTFDEQTNKILEETYSYIGDNGTQENIQFKDIYEALTPEQKKYYNDLGKAGADAFKKGLEGAFKDIRNIKSTIEYNQSQRDKGKQIETLGTEYQNIQIEEENKKAFNELQRLKQNIGFLGYGLGQPGVSQQRLDGLQTQIKDQETTYGNIVKLNENIKKQRALGMEIDEEAFNKQMKDLNQTLTDGVDKAIQGAINSFNSYEIQGILDDPQKFTEISRQILSSMDADISGLSDTAFKQKQFVLQSFNDLVTQKQEYLQNMNTLNKDMSSIKGYYVNDNGEPIMNEFGQKILIPEQSTMEPVFDKEKGVLYTFSKNEQGELVANKQNLFDSEKMDDNVVNGYISALQSGDLSLEGLLKSGIDKDIINKVMAQYNASEVNQGGQSSSQGQGFSGDISMNQNLINKYPNEAAFKNNNPTGMTWNKNFEQDGSLATLLNNAGVKYDIGTARPEKEGGNYVKFASVDDGMKAYETLLTKASYDDVNLRLQKWVGTSEGPTYAANLMQKAGIPMGAKFSELSETQLLDLMSYHLQKESPNFYKEVILGGASTQGTQTETSYTPLQEKLLKDFDGKDIGKLAGNLGVNEKQARNLYNQYLSQNQGSTDDEMNDKAMGLIQGLGGTEGERAKLAENIVKTAKKNNITLQEAKKRLGYKTGDDVEFAKVRKEDIESRKKNTLGTVSKAKETLLVLNNPASAVGDVMATVGFLKIIDPSSVARESEVASVENARGLADTVINTFTKMGTGEKLTEEQRKQLKDAIGTIVNAAEKNYYSFLNDTKSEFNERGLDSDVYIGKTDNEKAKDYEIVYSKGGQDYTKYELLLNIIGDFRDGLINQDEIKTFLKTNGLYTQDMLDEIIKAKNSFKNKIENAKKNN